MKIRVETNSGAFDFECGATDKLLHAGLAQGLALPYECATGTCGTCRARIMQGSAHVGWEQAPGFAKLKREKGDVLMCQTCPGSDCVVRVPAKVVARPDCDTLPQHRTAHFGALRKLTPDVMHFELALSRPMRFEAGQFVLLEVPEVEGGRAYSMVNFGRDVDRLVFVIKQKPGGAFSDWLFRGGAAGRAARVFGPLGRATFHPREGKNILCIAGGSGIAGMLSIIEHAASEDYFRDHTGHVFFGVRTLEDGFYLSELCDYAGRTEGRLEVTLALSHAPAPAATHPKFPHIRLAEGMVADAARQAMSGRCDNMLGFVAGPPVMVDHALRMLIRDARLPPQFVRYDKFA
ncbi:MAG: 2Fe-2S iron-sulfur cluster binding domain-containing protein [Xanthobacteraceae bacterium]